MLEILSAEFFLSLLLFLFAWLWSDVEVVTNISNEQKKRSCVDYVGSTV